MKKVGCILLLALPAIGLYYWSVTQQTTRYEKTMNALIKAADQDRPPKPATLAEAKRIAQEDASRVRAMDTRDIEELLRANKDRLARQALAQIGGEGVAGLSCRAVASNSTQQSESSAWWSLDFECLGPGDKLPNKTTVSVRLEKKANRWKLD